MQQLIQNVLPPAVLGAVLAMVSIGVVDASPLNKRLSLQAGQPSAAKSFKASASSPREDIPWDEPIGRQLKVFA